MLKSYAFCLSRCSLIVLGAAALEHQAATGTWPTNLQTIGHADLIDPTTGTAFQLTPTATGLEVRSTLPGMTKADWLGWIPGIATERVAQPDVSRPDAAWERSIDLVRQRIALGRCKLEI